MQALDPDGEVCGATLVTKAGQHGLLACYGDNPTTHQDEGASPGDVLTFTIDGQVAIVNGQAVWRAHGDLVEVGLGAEVVRRPWQLYLPLVKRGN